MTYSFMPLSIIFTYWEMARQFISHRMRSLECSGRASRNPDKTDFKIRDIPPVRDALR